MPNKDKTGPLGKGALTGKRLGPCGVGRGFGFNKPVQFTEEQEKEVLEAEKKEIEKRLKELE